MNRPLFFIISSIIVFFLILAWVYILFLRPPSEGPAGENYANLNLEDTTETGIEIPREQEDSPTLDTEDEKELNQLTLDPVAGFQEVLSSPSSTPEIYYIESGIGHIYSIDLSNGEEGKISGITIPSTREGSVTPDGSYALLQSGRGSAAQFFVISLTTESAEAEFLANNITSFVSSEENTFMFTTKEKGSLVGVEYYPISKTSREIFKVPFTEAVVDWGNTYYDTHYVHPKANHQLEGYLYAIKPGEEIKRLPVSGFGLTSFGNNQKVVYSKQENSEYVSFLYDVEQKNSSLFELNILPEKCATFSAEEILFICAGSTENKLGHNVPDFWYEGGLSFNDMLWEINTNTGKSSMLLDPLFESGRVIDIIEPKIGNITKNVYFQNKNDLALWMFEKKRDKSDDIVSTEETEEITEEEL